MNVRVHFGREINVCGKTLRSKFKNFITVVKIPKSFLKIDFKNFNFKNDVKTICGTVRDRDILKICSFYKQI